jgi:ABC-type bacteriocin/lantibiotic exporter with double-glycine peptidase domain
MSKKVKRLSFKKVVKIIFYSSQLMFRSNRLGTVFVALSNIVWAVIPPLVALLVGIVINEVTHGNWQGFVFYLIVMAGLGIFQMVLDRIGGYYSWRMQYEIRKYALEKLYFKVVKIPISVREQKENSDQLEIAENYGMSIGWLFPQLMQVVSQFIAAVMSFMVLMNLSLLIAIVVLIFTMPSVIMAVYRMLKERKYYKENSVQRRKGWGLRSHLTDQKMAMELKLNGLGNYFTKEWQEYAVYDRKLIMKIDRKLLPFETGIGILSRLVEFGVLLWSGKQVIDGALEVGFIVTIRQLMESLSGSLYSLTTSISQIGLEIMNASDYFDYLELPEEEDGDVVLDNGKGSPKIEFRNVIFTYPMNKEPTIKNVSFVVEPGEDIALVGENGSGKTTIIKLLLGIYKPDSGQVLINDIPIEKLKRDSYYKNIGALFQDYARYEFADLSENIWYGDINKKMERKGLLAVIEKAKLGPLLKKLPHGFSQILSKRFDEENGTDLSGGQWQRVALARSFWRNPNILILDEPTSSVDAKAEYEIFQEIAKAQVGKTTIIISHRFSTVRKAEKIMVIEDGQIVEQGTHRQLMQHRDGLYQEMFSLQAEGYIK